MRVLQVHNFYQQAGGEDKVYEAEYELLARHGHAVIQYSAQNDTIARMSGMEVATRALWNPDTYREIARIIKRESPDIVHAHNTFPIVSPSIYYAAGKARIPVVQTLHNYRLLCPAATLFRDGKVCEECIGSATAYKAVVHRCYRHSASASAAVASMLLAHRIAGTWNTKVDTYIALTNFARDKFVEGGLPPGKIVVKPNFLNSDPGAGAGNGNYAFFAGRLSEEKGVRTLLDSWARPGSTMPLKIAGDGPLATYVKERASTQSNIEWLGYCQRERLMELLQEAAILVFPSLWYEGLPMTIVEAMACGTPVVASGLGSMNELIRDGINGFRFTAGDAGGLADCIRSILARPDELREMRRSSRLCYEQNYTPERNYELLMEIYQNAAKRGAAVH